MSVYRYSGGSVIDEVTFVKSDGGSLRAYLHATPDTPEKTLSDISLALAKRGWQTVPNSIGGKQTLEVRGFDRNTQLNSVLFDNGWAKGKAEITPDKKDNSKLWDKFRKRSLFLSGISFVISDTCYTIYGQKDKSPLNAAAGLAYMAGGIASSVFARKDTPDLQIKEIAGRMANHMQAQNIELPDDCAINSIIKDKHKGIIKSTDDLFRRYPSELTNTLFGLAGALIATDALKNRIFFNVTKDFPAVKEILKKEINNFKKNSPHLSEDGYIEMAREAVEKRMKYTGWSDAALGATTMASGAFGALVQEKAHDPDEPRKHGLAGIWEWIQERPLLVTGMGYLVSTGFHLASTMKDMKDGDSDKKKAAVWRMGFIGWTVLGEALIAISSKGHGKGVVSDKSVDESVISLSAELIAKQPPAKHEYLIDYMSGFLGRDDVLAKKDTEVKDLLRAQVELVKKNPWARCKEVSPPKPTVKNELFAPLPEDNKWQAVVAKSAAHNSPIASL